MSIFFRYIARRLFRAFGASLALFSLLIFMGDMFDKMNSLVSAKTGLGIILQFLLLDVPYWAVRVVPMATLLATLITVSQFAQSGEWLAVQAAGYDEKTFWRPLLYCSLFIAVLCFAAQETVLPVCYRKSQNIWNSRIHPEWVSGVYNDITLLAGYNEMIEAKTFRSAAGEIDRPLLTRFGSETLELDAQSARWDAAKKTWVFMNGVQRTLNGDALIRQEPFAAMDSGLSVPPSNLIPRTQDPNDMSLGELRRYMRRAAYLGDSRRRLDVALWAKIAYPFTNIVLCALGIPLALRLRRSPKSVSFGAALAIGFLYFWFIQVGQDLGQSGLVPAALAAWTPNVLFGGGAAYWFSREMN
ncbi:MAG: LptF/LptG family permease [Elusimicrobiota bacterium]